MIRWFVIATVLIFVSSIVRAAVAEEAMDVVAMSSKANHKKGVELYEMKRVIEAEEFFRKALTANPELRESYFYLGSIEHSERFNFEKALEFYTRGCDLKDTRSCDGARAVKVDMLAKASNSGRVTASAEPELDEAALWEQIRQNYIKKGLPQENTTSTVESLKKGLSKISAADRLNAIRNLEAGSR